MMKGHALFALCAAAASERPEGFDLGANSVVAGRVLVEGNGSVHGIAVVRCPCFRRSKF